MRILLAALLLAAGIAIGAVIPPVSGFVRGTLSVAGVPPSLLAFTSPPEPPKVAAPKAAAPQADHAEGEGQDDGHAHGKADTNHGKPGDDAHGEHAHSEAEGEEGHVKMTAEQVETQDIKVANAEGGTLSRHILVPGTITPDTDRIARVPAKVVGTVAEMRKRLGDAVKKDEVVAVLDSREVADAKSEYLTAVVRAELEKTNFDRQQALWDKRVSAESAYLNAKAVYTEATLRQDLARQKLSALGLNAAEVAKLAKRDETTPNASTLRQYELRSPLSGRIVERKVDVGTSVGKEGDPSDVYTVADLSTVWIELSVSTADLPQVREGAVVTVTPSQEGGERHEQGKVIFVSPLLNAETRAARVVVALPNRDMAWRPGTFVTAEVEIARDQVPVRVAKAALQTIEGKRVVFVRTEEGFEKREVELGRSDDDAVEVMSGLKAGEAIAVANTFLLKAELGKSEADHAH
ncbi:MULTISPECIES: efflux RND transporter periplasmic adaptor subunit [Methylobacterium]|jgi:cobalt-zinc-cadmium efflux system membrane fusion protein|uniref:efflux RND transporter periplasmic adaptor subunit n=1 Tax=Methylobacterium TaxID=407 RepID=UPI0008F4316F|nr:MULTISPECIES: efflux RND transporter periplasmic adaptor subunit [Methylobacterium]MBZ6412701.1 efflux RND transporter periplasmic adaptor subunit [Methylobacterium sp.]MBK3396708.1 efflux RND transporter periplasmic adaptor subunit [Methylobacterium ajmalii]MBK3407724.1 efflux RND transporter periplasmic adaptor subunit [Methylobacterium ajmalii]MBK3422212.1 efflux RND transporter periplasmic adaptor subunit [Methylobacterium ajmalii]SFF27722.1 membrane fusion protein, cobalt-zinc-cadmium 